MTGIWPKVPPELTQAQLDAREQYMKLWHEQLPLKYGFVEAFNHGFPSRLPHRSGSRTLEVGAGLGSHLRYERLDDQEYYCLEYREEFCREISKSLPVERVFCGSIEARTPWDDGFFDRIVAIHVLEHLRDLPRALEEVNRLLKADGFFDIVIPCEGGFAHTFARRISAQRLFEKTFGMDFEPIHKNEHVNSFKEIDMLLAQQFRVRRSSYFPLRIPLSSVNIAVGFRLTKK